MGWYDYISDLCASAGVDTAFADAAQASTGDENSSKGQEAGVDRDAAVKGGASTKTPASGTDEESDEEAEVNKADAKKGGDDGGVTPPKQTQGGDDDDDEAEAEDEPEEEEEEEEEEPVDPMPRLQEQCEKTAACAPLKHHYDECVERVTRQIDDNGKADEDCVEEFFHLMHCTTACAAPKLFKELR